MTLDASALELRTLIERAKDAESDDANRIIELIKRLSVGLIVSSFLFSLLKYAASLYRDERQNIREADHSEDIVRRFCVALESVEDVKARQELAERFLILATERNLRPLSDAPLNSNASTAMQGVVTELVGLLKARNSVSENKSPPTRIE